MALTFTLDAVVPGVDGNRITVNFVAGVLGVTVTASDFNTYYIEVAIGSGTWSDVATEIASSAAADLITMTVILDVTVVEVGLLQLATGSEGNGPGQYYSGREVANEWRIYEA